MKFSKKSAWIAIFASVLMAAIGWLILPEQVVVQLRFDGTISRTLPRTFAVLVPVALCILGSLSYLESNEGRSQKIGSLLVVGLGLIFPVFIWIIN